MPLNFKLPAIRPDVMALAGGMDVVISPMMAKPGTPRLAYNYEPAISGGLERVGGIEPFSGKSRPSDAEFQLMECSGGVLNAIVGNTLTGNTSAATGVVVYVSATQIAVTMVAGTFALEVIKVGALVVGSVTSLTPTIDGFTDNALSKASADAYQALIAKVPGSGRIRGLAIHDNVVYAWRDNVGATALAIYKSSTSGWAAVPLYYELSFTTGSVQPAEASTITQGAVSATVKRVVLQSGTWAGGTAAGRYIITAPSGGAFVAGALSTAGAGTVPAAASGVYLGSQITFAPGGRVRTDRYNFTGSTDTMRLYGCDGVNREFEFGNDILVPLVTGMTSVRATCVRAHKYYLFFSYHGSLQFSSIGNPYQYSVITGAGELATGDEITNLMSVGGNEVGASMMVMSLNSISVLYGNGSAATPWSMTPLSRVTGATLDSAQDIGGVIALDTPGMARYPTTQAFGNFVWDRISLKVDPLTRDKQCNASVFVATQSKYRIFFTDGTALCGFPNSKVLPYGGTQTAYDWTVLNYGLNVVFAVHGEINGVARTFYSDDQGWVYESDVGRSFAGAAIEYAITLCPINQKSPLTEKTYKNMQLEVSAQSACVIYTNGEFTEDASLTQQQSINQYGSGLQWDFSNWGQAYWGIPETSRTMMPLEGIGTAVTISIAGSSNSELPHTITAATVMYIPRRMTR